jgi:hypothetical protein
VASGPSYIRTEGGRGSGTHGKSREERGRVSRDWRKAINLFHNFFLSILDLSMIVFVKLSTLVFVYMHVKEIIDNSLKRKFDGHHFT